MLKWLQTKIHRGIRLGIILLIAGIVFSILSNPYVNLQVQPFTILNKNRETIAGKLYLPDSKKTPFPVVILGHGINNSKQHAHLLAVEFARNGIAAIAFDYRGFGESSPLTKSENLFDQLTVTTLEDTKEIYDYIQNTPPTIRFSKNRDSRSLDGRQYSPRIRQKIPRYPIDRYHELRQ
ncbi:alpha/beta hydrolase [Pannus brasiliensis CCIBt3594]|uniref:Alpha/beta hydrolase n=1 Tax=Pannus brasiliensis CCIBt3594 TaxID=1427578 RepID=A0AAW9QS50_9CHRO